MVESAVVIGTGLIGTSIALALRQRGVDVALSDRDSAALELACELGAGTPLVEDLPEPADIAVVAVPPSAVPAALRDAQQRGLARVYTDVASVKTSVVRQAAELGCTMASYVPGHPMGGREKQGPSAARADLFLGRSWALCPTPQTDPVAVKTATLLAELCGANPLVVDETAHDRAVALVSHAPHAVSAAVAASLLDGDDTALALAGQGLRDMTRIAGGDVDLWREILSHNAGPVAAVLEQVAADLAAAAAALRTGTLDTVVDLLRRGRAGHARVPGKRGIGPTPDYAVLSVVIPDEPGALGRLFAAAAEAGVNVEDVRIDHSPGLPLGVAQLSVVPEARDRLERALTAGGWSVHR
ncbi:prephenate dehydrogenase [Thermobifida fusca]|jgi:prephenate dehydrogenase|uniref:Prephenate dehydrogenase n=3 Tax=Actinomycetes TaxID=1760 RepID=A0A9P2TAM3_THEFU|nr:MULTISPECIES: prephenate dehydrogenase [Thermobifida]AAZ55246.1 prephenate dehydrogenase [Thermobifida fusca YX]EOR71709.1 prephenate dehydrogenase [Thermobifida fusca TM51]MBO2530734.1 prephenate dehydrogenase/arogenate dehydrogenase family protein [Thermobifida sp.]PPS92506.1 prephenate dehydrogenase [Thermobifida fusca]PZN60788.1 MAG: prephenate dehydrogenase/arogenate dehydrogenase family protein [Thermobifida fusca]